MSGWAAPGPVPPAAASRNRARAVMPGAFLIRSYDAGRAGGPFPLVSLEIPRCALIFVSLPFAAC